MRRLNAITFATACVLLSGALSSLRADDWPQWLGPKHDSVWRESGIAEKFPAGGPNVVWRAPIAGGYSGPAVANGRVLVTDYAIKNGTPLNDPGGRPKLQGQERVWCLDAATGKKLWSFEYDCNYEISYPAGPRATPTIDGELVYVLGAQGHLHCLNVATGAVVWLVQLADRYQAPTPIWGFCSHPLVNNGKVYVMAGGAGSAIVALDKLTGREVWRALSASDAGYAPPVMIEVGGKHQLVVWHPQAVSGMDPDNGEVYWTTKLEPDYGMSINGATLMGHHLFIGGIKNKALMLALGENPPTVREVWRPDLRIGIGPVHTPPVPVGDVFYGVNRNGELTAVEVATGKRLWETTKVTTGGRPANSATAFLVRNGDKFFIMSETGELIIARLTPEKYEELDRAKILEPTHEAFGRNVLWSHPAFANKSIYARNDKEIVCIRLGE